VIPASNTVCDNRFAKLCMLRLCLAHRRRINTTMLAKQVVVATDLAAAAGAICVCVPRVAVCARWRHHSAVGGRGLHAETDGSAAGEERRRMPLQLFAACRGMENASPVV